MKNVLKSTPASEKFLRSINKTYRSSEFSYSLNALTPVGNRYQELLKLIGTVPDDTKLMLLDGLKELPTANNITK